MDFYELFPAFRAKFIPGLENRRTGKYTTSAKNGDPMMRKKQFVPKYERIFAEIRGKIVSGEYPRGFQLPTGKELCRMYSVSQITISSVFARLKESGLIRSIPHKGSFVCYEPEDDYFHDAVSGRKKTQIVHTLLAPTPVYRTIMNLLANIFMQNNPEVNIVFRELRPKGNSDPYWELQRCRDLPTCGEFFWHARYARDNMLCPLEGMERFETLRESLYTQFVYPTVDSRGESHIHALPLFLGIPIFMILNRDICRKAGVVSRVPRSWPKLLKLTEELSKTSRKTSRFYVTTMNAPRGYSGVKPWVEMLGQDSFSHGVQCTDPECFRKLFSTPGALAALKNIGSLMKNGMVRYQKGVEYFALGDTAFMPFSANWTLSLIRTIMPDMDKLIFAPPPVGTNRVYRSFASTFSVGLFRQGIRSESQKLITWKWLRFLLHPQSQYLLTQEYRLPVRKDAAIFLKETEPELYEFCSEVLVRAIPQPDFAGMRKSYEIAGKHIVAFLHHRLTPEQCLGNIVFDLSASAV